MGLLPLYNVLETKSLVAAAVGQFANDSFTIPDFVQGEALTIDFYLLTRNSAGGFASPWTRVAVGTYSVKIGLFDSTSTQLALVTAFVDDGVANKKTGTLVQNSGAVTGALGAASKIAITIEIEITDANGNIFKSYQRGVSLLKQYITNAAVTAPIGQVAATQDWVKSLFVAKEAATGDILIVRDDLGNRYLVYPDEDGFMHADKL